MRSDVRVSIICAVVRVLRGDHVCGCECLCPMILCMVKMWDVSYNLLEVWDTVKTDGQVVHRPEAVNSSPN